MLLSIAIGAMTWFPVGSGLAIARRAGADGVELLVTPIIARRGANLYGRLAMQRDIPIVSVHSMLRLRPTSFERKLADDVASIHFAGEIPTCRVVVLHPPTTGVGYSAQLDRWLDAMCRARDTSGNPSLRITLENLPDNHDGTPDGFIDRLDRLRHVAGEWGLGVTLDIAHAASHNLDLQTAIQLVLPQLDNVHLSDARRRRCRGGVMCGLIRDHQLPGEGSLPLSEVLATLTSSDFEGLLTLEFSPTSLRIWWPWGVRTRLIDAVRETRSHVESVGALAAQHEKPRHRAV